MLKVVVVLAIAVCAHAALQRAPLEEKPEKFKDQEGCYISELDAVIPFGQARPSKKQCEEYRCGQDQNYVVIASCSVIQQNPSCTTVSDGNKPYPDCCPRLSCPST